MKMINSKVLSYEEDLIEYESQEEFDDDFQKRKKDGWLIVKNFGTDDFTN